MNPNEKKQNNRVSESFNRSKVHSYLIVLTKKQFNILK